MLVKWNKDVDAALAEAKAQDKPLLIDFSISVRRRLEALALGWKPSPTATKKSQTSSIKTLCRSKLTSKSIRPGSNASTRCGRRPF